jgi:hypothetical protein
MSTTPRAKRERCGDLRNTNERGTTVEELSVALGAGIRGFGPFYLRAAGGAETPTSEVRLSLSAEHFRGRPRARNRDRVARATMIRADSSALLRLFQEISAAPSRDDARRVFEAVDASQLSEHDYELVCIYYANALYEFGE